MYQGDDETALSDLTGVSRLVLRISDIEDTLQYNVKENLEW